MKDQARLAIEDSRAEITNVPNYGRAASLLARREGISIDDAFSWINQVRFTS